MDPWVAPVVSAVAGFLLGALPTGMLVGRARGVDMTRVGSRRTGATNVLRTLGWGAASIVFLGDLAKGAAAVLVARGLTGGGLWWGGDPWSQVAAATMAVIGHNYSPFIGWRGGRGVVTGMGGLVLLWPQAFLVAFLIGGIALALTRYVSLGSITGTIIAGLAVIAIVIYADQSTAYVFYGLLLPLFIVVSHRDNIVRLLRGTERKLGEKA
jgi:acyl phosphate:glycerol-3-phosphate acyltransferase